MAYEFKKLADIEAVETATDAANVLIEESGEIKRVPKSDVGFKLPEGGTEGQVLIKTADGEGWGDVATSGSTVSVAYVNADSLDADTTVEYAKELKDFWLIDGHYVYRSGYYRVQYSETADPCDACSTISTWKLYVAGGDYSAFQITQTQYNEILAAWETVENSGTSTVSVVSTDDITADTAVEYAKALQDLWIVDGNYVYRSEYQAYESTKTDPCDACSTITTWYVKIAEDHVYQITETQCDEIHAAWTALAGA